MDSVKVKRRRTSTKHSQTGCKTCKTRHIKCDENRPRCLNCEKGDRSCVYAVKSPKTHTSPLPPESATSSVPYFNQPFTFRPAPTHAAVFPSPTNQSQRLPFEDIYSVSHSFESAPHFGPQRSNTPSSITSSPQIHHPTTSTGLVRNAVLVNNVQSQVQVQRAIHAFSRDFRLRGQLFTVETVLSPLIYRTTALKHAVYANFILQAEQSKGSPSARVSTQDLSKLHVRHYKTAINHLQTTLNNHACADTNVGACLILSFYDLCAGDMEHYTTHIRMAAEQIRIRGATLDNNPLPLHMKFLFHLYMRTDTVGSNAVGQPSNVDPEIVRIVYHGVPISNKSLLPHRIELELILADISHFQYESDNILPQNRAWRDPHQEALFRQRYEDLLARLQRWQERDPELLVFEEAVGEYPHGSMLPPEMGLPLLCVNDQELAQMWCLHCAATIHLHFIAVRHHVISHIPVEARTAAILCGRILSGISIIDPIEPSVTAIWPLINMSYALDFEAGKIWVADQLESIAKRYLNRNARIVADKVRETMLSEEPNLNFITAMRSDPPALGGHGKLVVPEQQTWEPPMSEPDLFHSFLHEERRASSSVSLRDSGGLKVEEDLYGTDPRGWEHRLQ